MIKTAEIRARELLSDLSLDEKIYQICCQMVYPIREDYDSKRNYKVGNCRNIGHFLHESKGRPMSPEEVAEAINDEIRCTAESNSHSIPPIEHGEALHGAQWGMATCFPQPIAMASMFDSEAVEKIADAIGKECAVAGVRQALTPVVNVARDCRWGRTVETFGEDVLLNADMGAAMCRGLQKNGVIATPKHFADNYSYGGRDSNVSDTSERTMREVYLPPFEKCIKEGGAMSVMAAYNSWDGVPCSCNKYLLTDILRKEWGFDGFVVSDYGGVDNICYAHRLFDSSARAQAESLKAGLDINFPHNSFDNIKEALDKGYIEVSDIDNAVLRVLTAKYKAGLFENPYGDSKKASEIVRCAEHQRMALDAARKSIVLLKNENVLPLSKNKIRKIAVFGLGATLIPVGDNYSGPFRVKWTADDAKTPLQYIKEYLNGYSEVIFADDDEIESIAPLCDAALYFTSLIEGEGMDRSDIRLPGVTKAKQKNENAIIVGANEFDLKTNQEESIRKMCSSNKNSAVILLNGSPIDMSAWIETCPAIIEAWYPGEQGAQAITEIIFGQTNPSGKLPITFPRSVGQLPLFYSMKPSGRGYGYVDNDGSPLYPFGYGLSYTNFEFDKFCLSNTDNSLKIRFSAKNTGDFDGEEVIQIYFSGRNCDVVMPLKELKAYKRFRLNKKESLDITVEIPDDAFLYYDRQLKYGMHNGDYTISVGTSSTDIRKTFEVRIRNGLILTDE